MMLLELCNGRGCLALRFMSSKRGCDMGGYTPVHLIEQRHSTTFGMLHGGIAAASVVEPRARAVEPHPFHRLLQI